MVSRQLPDIIVVDDELSPLLLSAFGTTEGAWLGALLCAVVGAGDPAAGERVGTGDVAGDSVGGGGTVGGVAAGGTVVSVGGVATGGTVGGVAAGGTVGGNVGWVGARVGPAVVGGRL